MKGKTWPLLARLLGSRRSSSGDEEGMKAPLEFKEAISLLRGVSGRSSELESLGLQASKLLTDLEPAMMLLQLACQEAGLVRPRKLDPRPQAPKSKVESLVSMLKADQMAAKSATSASVRYWEGREELDRIHEALDAGKADEFNFGRARGKLYYLTSMRFALLDYPILATALGLSRPSPKLFEALSRQVATGGPRAGGAPSASAQFMNDAKSFLTSLEVRLSILLSALEDVSTGPRFTRPLLSPKDQMVAKNLALVIACDRPLRERVGLTVSQFDQAKAMVNGIADWEPGKVRNLLGALCTLPQRFEKDPVLSQIFPKVV